ncbi:MAG: MFS transporter, partial [Verrucomicrobia bacterium]
MEPVGKRPLSGAQSALFLLLAINLFNYIDRQVLAALEPDIRASFFAPGD